MQNGFIKGCFCNCGIYRTSSFRRRCAYRLIVSSRSVGGGVRLLVEASVLRRSDLGKISIPFSFWDFLLLIFGVYIVGGRSVLTCICHWDIFCSMKDLGFVTVVQQGCFAAPFEFFLVGSGLDGTISRFLSSPYCSFQIYYMDLYFCFILY